MPDIETLIAEMLVLKEQTAQLLKEVQITRKMVASAMVPSSTKSPNEILADISVIKGVGETIRQGGR